MLVLMILLINWAITDGTTTNADYSAASGTLTISEQHWWREMITMTESTSNNGGTERYCSFFY